MKPWNTWLASLGMAGLCMTWVGCGGGDSTSTASNEASTAPAAEGDAASSEPAVSVAEPSAPAPEPAAPTAAAPTEAAQPAPAPGPEVAAKPAEEAAPQPDAPRAEAASSTAAMLAAANNTPAPAAAGTTADPAMSPAGSTAAEPTPTPAPEPAPVADAGPAPAPPPNLDDPEIKGHKADFRSPYTAVTAFLIALKARDPVKLAEATALRAPTEAKPKNQPLFTSILEQSLSEDDLAELATKLEGFTIADHNIPKSTGTFSIILMKPGTNGSRLVRTITARHEKAGWKVVDISGQGELEKPLVMPRFGNTRGRRR